MQYHLTNSLDGVALTWEGVNWRPLAIAFDKGSAGYRLAHVYNSKELLAKAIGSVRRRKRKT